ncbi:LysR family transcriptional regulator [Nocardia cyriacigeorgica]|uniref:LysR family transcriptional regulator n=1 Tax=Nocardia cyriacigeorgica TaxID=135487 RepID=UPI0024550D9F|nr:LysR family transcriptional regulator [Nocardia cyriacigeorgica]
MELRDIEIFLTLAEELHFGRTAQRLHVTPARVSQVIKKQERRIGAALFDRTTRTVRLTSAGEQLHRELAAGYRQIMDGIANVSAAARSVSGTLLLGTMGPQAWMLNAAVEAFRENYPAVDVGHREINPVDPLTPLRTGEVDIAHVWLPVCEPDLTVGPVTHTSPIMVMLSANHPLAQRESLSLEDYGDLTFVAHNSPVPPYMEQVFQPFHTPSGRAVPRGPVVANWEEQLKAVGYGQAVMATVAEAADFYPWPDLTYVPVRDAPPCRWALVWRTSSETALVRAFAETVADGGE